MPPKSKSTNESEKVIEKRKMSKTANSRQKVKTVNLRKIKIS
jgi:hypothetical protein